MINYLLNTFPSWVLCFAFSGLCISISLFIHKHFKKRIKRVPLESFNESGGITFGTISLIYSLILAFVIVAVWEDYEEINKGVIEEAAKLADMHENAARLPLPIRDTIQLAVVNYAKTEIDNEWHKYTHERHRNPEMQNLRTYLQHLDSTSGLNEKVTSNINDDIADIMECRYTRNSLTRSHIPLLVWIVLLVGSIIVMFFSWFFTMEPPWVNRLFTGMVTCMLSMCLFLLFMLDHPLCGTSAVSSAPLEHVVNEK